MVAKFIQHRSPQTNKAKAPYNFVPLPEKVLSAEEFNAHDRYDPNRHTGYIDLEITTETPLYTRCATPTEVWSKYKNSSYFEDDKPKVTHVRECQDFFHHGNIDIPVIPGSTLRGMTRALVEILAYGKMSFITNKKLVYRSIADRFYRETFSKERDGALDYPVSQLKAGYLENHHGEYFIRPALRDRNGETFLRIEYKDFERFEPNWEEHQVYENFYVKPPMARLERNSRNGRVKLRLPITQQIRKNQEIDFVKVKIVTSGHMSGQTEKHMHYAIYEPDDSLDINQLIRIDDALWKTYTEDMEISRGIEPRKLGSNRAPLFYLIDYQGKLIFFGPTMLFRLPYEREIQDFIPEILQCPSLVDIAESVFGRVENKAIAGRVFFGDAICETQNPFFDNKSEGRFVPKILSSPKPTSFQLYLAQPEPNHRNDLKNYNHIEKTVIRGSKRYWHNRDMDFEEKNVPINHDGQGDTFTIEGTQHTIIRPVKPKSKFKGRVYFENLSDLELGAMLTALELPPEKRHQIGMAKPYGLGSIEIKPTLVLQNRESRYRLFFNEKSNGWNKDEKSLDEIKQIKTSTTNSFQEVVLNHYNCLVTQNSKASQFWAIPRLETLATLLEWKTSRSFNEKKYADLEKDKKIWRNRYVLPYPQAVENSADEPKPIQLIDPNLWAESCLENSIENIANEEAAVEPPPKTVIRQSPEVPLALLNLPEAKVPSELNRFYQEWKKVSDENLKLEMAKAIVEKSKTWKKAKTKTWFLEVVEFIEKTR